MKTTNEAMDAISTSFKPKHKNVKRYPYEMTQRFFVIKNPFHFAPMTKYGYPNFSGVYNELYTFITSLERQDENYPLWVKFYRRHIKALQEYKKEIKSGKWDDEFIAQSLKNKDEKFYRPINLQSYRDVYLWNLTNMARKLHHARQLYKMENKLTYQKERKHA